MNCSHVWKRLRGLDVLYPWETAAAAPGGSQHPGPAADVCKAGTGGPVSRKAPATVCPREMGPATPQLSVWAGSV